MDPKTDRLVRRLAMVGTATAAYFLLTADYGPYPNALDPIRNAIQSAQHSVKKLFFKTGEKPHSEDGEPNSGHGKVRHSSNDKNADGMILSWSLLMVKANAWKVIISMGVYRDTIQNWCYQSFVDWEEISKYKTKFVNERHENCLVSESVIDVPFHVITGEGAWV